MAAEYYSFYQVFDDTRENEERFTSGDEQLDDYEPRVMSRSDIMRSGKSSENELTISFANDVEFARSRLVNWQQIRYWVEIRIAPDLPPFWVGRIRTVTQNRTQIDIVFSSLLATLKQHGLPSHFQLTCRHSLYDNVCRVSRDINAPKDTNSSQPVTIDLIDANDQRVEITLTESRWPIKQASRGILEQGTRRYYVVSAYNNILVLHHRIKLQKGAATLWRGCDRTVPTCRDVFSNLTNYGGFPDMPEDLTWGQDIPLQRGDD